MNFTISALALIIAGLAAISNFIIAKKPEAAEQLDKLKPISGWVGVGLLLIGLFNFFGLGRYGIAYWDLFAYAKLMSFLPMMAVLLYSPICIVLGFMQGYSLIDKYVLNKAKEKGSAGAKFDKFGDSAYEKIVKYTTPVGFIGIAVGLILFLIQFEVITK
ncbi:MAG: hypothetical protein ACJASQ_000759 [Crocinitomicaceae bacterium]|jgi:hypothetical protein